MSTYSDMTDRIENEKRWLEAIVPVMRKLKIRAFQTVILEDEVACIACGRVSDVYYDGGGGRNLCKPCAKEEGYATPQDRL